MPVKLKNPYKLYNELKNKYHSPEPIIFKNTGLKKRSRNDDEWTPYTLAKKWVATPGNADKLSIQQRKIIHGILGQDQSFDMKELQDFSDVSPPTVPEIEPLDAPQSPSTSKK